MLILKTDAVLTKEQKEALRKEVKAHTGEDCIVLDRGVQVSEIRLKKRAASLAEAAPAGLECRFVRFAFGFSYFIYSLPVQAVDFGWSGLRACMRLYVNQRKFFH